MSASINEDIPTAIRLKHFGSIELRRSNIYDQSG
jgi:hypothetical protein